MTKGFIGSGAAGDHAVQDCPDDRIGHGLEVNFGADHACVDALLKALDDCFVLWTGELTVESLTVVRIIGRRGSKGPH